MKFYERLDVAPIKTEATGSDENNNKPTRWRATLNSGDITANGRRYNWSGITIPSEGVPVLFNHGGGGLFGGSFESELPVGRWDEIKLKGKGIEGVFHFGEDDHSQIVAEKWAAGLFDGISVGVIPHKTSEVEMTGTVPAHVVIETGLLVEASTVTVPADPKGRGHGREQMAAVLRELYGEEFDPVEVSRIGADVSRLLTGIEGLKRDAARIIEYQEREQKSASDQLWERARESLKS